jgi:hypothetical protein
MPNQLFSILPQQWGSGSRKRIAAVPQQHLNSRQSGFTVAPSNNRGFHLSLLLQANQTIVIVRRQCCLKSVGPSTEERRFCALSYCSSATDSHAMQDAHEHMEPWFDMPFASASIPEDLIASWSNQKPGPNLTLPPQNPFIPVNFDLLQGSPPNMLPSQGQDSHCTSAVQLGFVASSALGFKPPPGAVTAPECIVEAPGLRVLHKAVTEFGTPHAVALFRYDLQQCPLSGCTVCPCFGCDVSCRDRDQIVALQEMQQPDYVQMYSQLPLARAPTTYSR